MDFIWKIQLAVLVTSIVSGSDGSKRAIRNKREHFENFNVLLNLYKMNPLKKSPIYKSLTNRFLLPNRNYNAAVNVNFNETVFDNTRATLSVKQLEDILNTNTPKNNLNEPSYTVENIDHENFAIVKKETATTKESTNRKEDFNSIFGYLESVKSDSIPVTKMLPVNKNSTDVLNSNDIFPEPFNGQQKNVNEVFSPAVANNMDVAIKNSNVRTERKHNDDSVVILK